MRQYKVYHGQEVVAIYYAPSKTIAKWMYFKYCEEEGIKIKKMFITAERVA